MTGANGRRRGRWGVAALVAVVLALLAWTSCSGPDDPVNVEPPSVSVGEQEPERRRRRRSRRPRDTGQGQGAEHPDETEEFDEDAGSEESESASRDSGMPPASIDGVVLDDHTLARLPGGRVVYFVGHSSHGGVSRSTTTGKDGTFVIERPVDAIPDDADRIELVVSLAGYEVRRVPATVGPLQITLLQRRSKEGGTLRVYPEQDPWVREHQLAQIELCDEGGKFTYLLRRLAADGSIVVRDLEPGRWRVRQQRADWRSVIVVANDEVPIHVPRTTLDLTSFEGAPADLLRERAELMRRTGPIREERLEDPEVVHRLNRIGQLAWAIQRKTTYRDIVVRDLPEGATLVRLLGRTPHLLASVHRTRIPAPEDPPVAFDAVPVGEWTIDVRGAHGRSIISRKVKIEAGEGEQELRLVDPSRADEPGDED